MNNLLSTSRRTEFSFKVLFEWLPFWAWNRGNQSRCPGLKRFIVSLVITSGRPLSLILVIQSSYKHVYITIPFDHTSHGLVRLKLTGSILCWKSNEHLAILCVSMNVKQKCESSGGYTNSCPNRNICQKKTGTMENKGLSHNKNNCEQNTQIW